MHPITPVLWLGFVLLCGCGGSAQSPTPQLPPTAGNPTTPVPPPAWALENLPVPDNRTVAPPTILLFGNSHSAGDLPRMLQLLLQTGTGQPATTTLARGATYLDERLSDNVSQQQLASQPWSHLILQAQKYSTSGLYHYSTEAAQQWIALAKAKGVTPVLYPEHPRAGNREEGSRVFQLHRQIAAVQAACVAPIGPVWDAVIAQWPDIRLYSSDGNHAAPAGVLLTSYLLYEVISGNPADALPDLPALPVPVASQRLLRQAASAGIRQYQPCPF